jgi:hypothetical protein
VKHVTAALTEGRARKVATAPHRAEDQHRCIRISFVVDQRPWSPSLPKKPTTQWEVYRPIRGSLSAFIGVVEAPDEASALKTAIEEFGIINHEYQKQLFVRRVPRR